jgi:hypothetical protein
MTDAILEQSFLSIFEHQKLPKMPSQVDVQGTDRVAMNELLTLLNGVLQTTSGLAHSTKYKLCEAMFESTLGSAHCHPSHVISFILEFQNELKNV